MKPCTYSYEFRHIAENIKKGRLHRIDHTTANKEGDKLSAAVDDSQVLIRTSSHQVPSLLADLTDIAVSVYVADRLSQRKRNVTCRINVQVPVRNSKLLECSSIREELQDVLYWFTEDLWSFDFTPYVRSGRSAEVNQRLPFPNESFPRCVALWSGGLDALAGLYHRLLQDDTTHYTLFGTGGNETMFGIQKSLATKIMKVFPERVKLIQIPIRLKKGDVQTSSSARVRGFVFMLLGAVCALQEEQDVLYIHENGIGAINLPFRDSEVGLDHSRSVHPLSLYRMSKLLSTILEQPFSFENPFLFSTKAQVCTQLLQKMPELAFLTVSCDSRHRRVPMQCGYCSSCLLRRQAIAVLGKEDQTRYQMTEFPGDQEKSLSRKTHFIAMLAQVNTLKTLMSGEDSWQRMTRCYPILDEIVQKTGGSDIENQSLMRNRLQTLYQNYVSEWDNLYKNIKQAT